MKYHYYTSLVTSPSKRGRVGECTCQRRLTFHIKSDPEGGSESSVVPAAEMQVRLFGCGFIYNRSTSTELIDTSAVATRVHFTEGNICLDKIRTSGINLDV